MHTGKLVPEPRFLSSREHHPAGEVALGCKDFDGTLTYRLGIYIEKFKINVTIVL